MVVQPLEQDVCDLLGQVVSRFTLVARRQQSLVVQLMCLLTLVKVLHALVDVCSQNSGNASDRQAVRFVQVRRLMWVRDVLMLMWGILDVEVV